MAVCSCVWLCVVQCGSVWLCVAVVRLLLPVPVVPLEIVELDQVEQQRLDGGDTTCRRPAGRTELVGEEPHLWNTTRIHLNTPT